MNSSTKKSGNKNKSKKRKRESDCSSDDISDVANSDYDDES